MTAVRRLAGGRRALWTLAILAGLGVRLALVTQMGTNDMNSYVEWGREVGAYGLTSAYEGIYYPLQYEIFRAAVSAASFLGISIITALKIGNLICDVGIFVLLVQLLRRLRLPPSYALIYWVHPYFLAVSWLGYIDMQVGLLLVLTLLAVSYSTRPWHFLLAGLPLGAIFVMKPQGATFVYVLVLAAGVALVAWRRPGISPAGMALARSVPWLLVGPVVLFVIFSLVLKAGGDSVTYLAHTYSPGQLARQSPSLNANMTNVWYLVADAQRHHGEPAYLVTTPDALNAVAEAATLVLLVAGSALLLRRRGLSLTALMLAVLGMSAIIWPMTLTHAHENHLYYGALLGIVLLPIVRRRWFTLGFQGLLLLQFVNIGGRYGFGLNHLTSSAPTRWLTHAYREDAARVAVTVLAIACFLIVVVELARWAWQAQPSAEVELGTFPPMGGAVQSESG